MNDLFEWFHDDITWCGNECSYTACERNLQNRLQKGGLMSIAIFKDTEVCPLNKSAEDKSNVFIFGSRKENVPAEQPQMTNEQMEECIKETNKYIRQYDITWQNGKCYCGYCGKRIPRKIKARYCHKCGHKINWSNKKGDHTINVQSPK